MAGRENCLQQDEQIPSCMLAAGMGPAPREELRLMAEITMTFSMESQELGFQSPTLLRTKQNLM